jgi:hypothetical protein
VTKLSTAKGGKLKNKHMKKLLFVMSSIFLAAAISCTKEGNNQTEPKAVVEAFLQPGVPLKVKVTKEIVTGSDNSGSGTINGLDITIKADGVNYTLQQNASGNYENATIPVVAGKRYELSFVYNMQTITAATIVPEKPVNFTCSPSSVTVPNFNGGPGGGIPSLPEPIKAKWNNSSSQYHYIVIKSTDPNAAEISNRPGGNFSNTPDQGSSKEINFGEFKYYGKNALILYRIQPEFAALYNAVSSNSQNLSAIPTNITNGLGIFTAVNIADTLFVEVKE